MRLLFQIAGERVEPRLPEFPVVREPFRGSAQRCGRQFAGDDAARFFPRDESGILEHAQMFDKPRQRHAERLRKLAHGTAAGGERREYAPARRVGERGEYAIKSGIVILNHIV